MLDATPNLAPAPKVSVVLATYNRLDLLIRVLDYLAKQTIPSDQFEVVVVDDGSAVPVPDHVDPTRYPFELKLVRQDNAGPAAARHRGVLLARGDILVFLDDDMQLPSGFLEAHLAYHRDARVAVIGRYISDPDIDKKPIFERYHGIKWDLTTQYVQQGKLEVDGTFLATGNTSMRREDYLRVGGFDASLPRAEDIALGLDLEASGVKMVYSDYAGSIHLSDHTNPETWMRRAYIHGRLETRIAAKHMDMAHADPWRFAFALPITGRILCLPAVFVPSLGAVLATTTYKLAAVVDKLGLEKPALRATGLVYGMEYFRGMRDEAGSVRRMIHDCATFLDKVSASARPTPGVPKWLPRAVSAIRKRNGRP